MGLDVVLVRGAPLSPRRLQRAEPPEAPRARPLPDLRLPHPLQGPHGPPYVEGEAGGRREGATFLSLSRSLSLALSTPFILAAASPLHRPRPFTHTWVFSFAPSPLEVAAMQYEAR